MLPIIDLDITGVVRQGFDMISGEMANCGYAIALSLDTLKLRSLEKKLNLDRYLSSQLARGFTLNHVKRPILIWFGLRYECAIISFSDKHDRYVPVWASERFRVLNP